MFLYTAFHDYQPVRRQSIARIFALRGCRPRLWVSFIGFHLLGADTLTIRISIYQSCGILGATVMPHSLFLGSGIVQPRLRKFDIDNGHVNPPSTPCDGEEDLEYRPSIHAIRGCLKYSIVELTLSLFTFALFVNSAILVVAGAYLFGIPGADNADLFGIHQLLSQSISPAAGTIFALALLLSGLSAGIICTMAGQIVSEGMIRWKLTPWIRRLVTRLISITPSIIIASAVGQAGLNATLNASQVVLSVILPFVTAPLLYFTCRNRYMTVKVGYVNGEGGTSEVDAIKMRNSWPVSALGLLVWLAITALNVALIVFLGLGTG
jgi:metal iron transporter